MPEATDIPAATQPSPNLSACETASPSLTDEHPVKPWPTWLAWLAFFTNWIVPETTARRTANLPLPWAFAAHILAALLTAGLWCVFLALGDLEEAFYYVRDIPKAFHDYPDVASLVACSSVLATEAIFAIVALLIAPWGARNERFRASYASALRQAWLHTSHLLPIVLAVGLLVVAYANADQAFRQANADTVPWNQPAPQYPSAPSPNAPIKPTETTPADSPLWAKYQADLAKYNADEKAYDAAMDAYQVESQAYSTENTRLRKEYRTRQPFFVRYGTFFIAYAIIMSVAWFFWSLFRAVGAPRRVHAIVRPPTCEFCGYNLSFAPMEGRCSECGVPVIDSLGPDVRPDTLWEQRRETGRWPAYLQCTRQALLSPRSFGQRLQANSLKTDHRILFEVHLVLAFVVGWIGLVMTFLPWRNSPYGPTLADVCLGIAPYVTGVSLCFMLAVTLLLVVVVAGNYGVRMRRNLAGVAMKIAAYQSAYLVVWAAIASVWAIILSALGKAGSLRELARELNMIEPFLIMYSVLLVNLALAAVYLILIWRATSTTKYANR